MARERAATLDRALTRLVEEAIPSGTPLAVAAVGGYGRGELSPHSDIDLLFVADRKRAPSPAVLRNILYPLWDAGLTVGHALRSPREVVDSAEADLETATALLSARLIAGDEAPFADAIERFGRWKDRKARPVARRIAASVAERHARVSRAGWDLAPDLKDGAGGIRDAHAVTWTSRLLGREADLAPVSNEIAVMLSAREALHLVVGRKHDRLDIHLQQAVASMVGLAGDEGADDLMIRVHTAARVLEHRCAEMLHALVDEATGGPRRSGASKPVSANVRVEDGFLVVDRSVDPSLEGTVEIAAAHSHTGRPPSRASLAWMRTGASGTGTTGSWSAPLRHEFMRLLEGGHAASALELLDAAGAWRPLLSEWQRVRGRAQHDHYHRYTVDGHSFVTVEEVGRAVAHDELAAKAASEAGDLATLRLAALLHDVGKGSGEDHSVAGERIARAACTRMGLSTEEIDEVALLVREHLLLVDTATRRDLDDGAVIAGVAERIGSPRALRLLYVLTIADARATGAEAWTPWKAALVLELFRKVLVALESGHLPQRRDVAARVRELEAFEPTLAGRSGAVLETLPVSYLDSTSIPELVDDVRLLLHPPSPGTIKHRIDPGVEPDQLAVTIVTVDRPGTLARAAGVFALHRVSVLSARGWATTNALALERFIVLPPPSSPLEVLVKDLSAAFSGRLALEPRIERKARDYRPRERVEARVEVLQDASPHSTVVEVRGPDVIGLLYAVTAGIGDLDLDIHVAKIDTLGRRVVDVFYVRTAWGAKLDDGQVDEVTRAIEHRVARLFG